MAAPVNKVKAEFTSAPLAITSQSYFRGGSIASMRSVPFARPWIFFSFYPIGDSFLSRLNNRVANRRIPARSLRAIRFERVRTGARTETSMFSARYNEVFAQLGLLGSRGGVIREVEGSFDGTLAIRGIYETKTNGNYDFLFRETSREKKG